MKDYEQEISKLTPDRKRELWDKYKDLNIQNKTKFSLIYYEAIAKGYLSR